MKINKKFRIRKLTKAEKKRPMYYLQIMGIYPANYKSKIMLPSGIIIALADEFKKEKKTVKKGGKVAAYDIKSEYKRTALTKRECLDMIPRFRHVLNREVKAHILCHDDIEANILFVKLSKKAGKY